MADPVTACRGYVLRPDYGLPDQVDLDPDRLGHSTPRAIRCQNRKAKALRQRQAGAVAK